ncbi:MAG: hypothetical protein ACK5UO_10320, partial [Microcystis sp.]
SPTSPLPHFPTSPLPHFPTSPLPHFPTSPLPHFPASPKNQKRKVSEKTFPCHLPLDYQLLVIMPESF